MPTPPRRRWFQFSVRTLLVLVTAVAILSNWLGYHLNWIRQRHAFIAACPQLSPCYIHGTSLAPVQLRLLGEGGVEYIGLAKRYEGVVRRLFPEARIVIVPGWERTVAEMKHVNKAVPGYYVSTIYDE